MQKLLSTTTKFKKDPGFFYLLVMSQMKKFTRACFLALIIMSYLFETIRQTSYTHIHGKT